MWSLAIPYFLWNLLAIFYFYAVHRLFSNYIDPNYNNIEQYGLKVILQAFWTGTDGNPIAYQFWFIRDLFMMSLLAPLFYVVMKGHIGYFIVCIISLNYIFSIYSPLWLQSISWFGIGAFIGINKIDILAFLRSTKGLVIIAYALFVIMSLFDNRFVGISYYLGVFASFDIARILNAHGKKMPKILSDSAFFSYAFHGCTIMAVTRLLYKALPHNDIALSSVFLLAPLIMISISVSLYSLMKITMPNILNILIGRRLDKT